MIKTGVPGPARAVAARATAAVVPPGPASACTPARGVLASPLMAVAALRVLLPLLVLAIARAGVVHAGTAASVETWPLPALEEPSGVVYHPLRGTLFVVSDEGGIYEVSTAGEILASRRLGGDLEGVTCDPATGLVYAVREGHEVIFEIDPEDLSDKRRFTIDRAFGGNDDFLQRGGDGIEGITFVPADGHPEGGRFFAVNQNDPPVLLELAVPIRSAAGRFATARVIKAFKIGSAPLSGVTWDASSRRLLIVSALWRVAYLADSDGGYKGSIDLPGLMQEGIALLPGGAFVIAQDSGGLIRWTPVEKLSERAGD